MRVLVTFLAVVYTAVFSTTALALTFTMPGYDDVVGETFVIRAEWEDTFADYARAYNIGHYELDRANPGVDEWLPGTGTKITIPGQFILPSQSRSGIVINLPELRLYYYDNATNTITTYPIGIGREGWPTPTTRTSVTTKAKDPTWYVPASILAEHEAAGDPIPAVLPPGPDNPLGRHSLRLDLPGYLIHGTNSPIGVGRRVTHGCIRLFPDDIEDLFNIVPEGTSVSIINEPIKAGWYGNELYLEVHPILAEYKKSEDERKVYLVDVLEQALQQDEADINWDKVQRLMDQQNGIPGVIGHAI